MDNEKILKILIIMILLDIYYIFFYHKLKLYNNNSIDKYIPIKFNNPYQKNIKIIHINSLKNLSWELIKYNSNNLQEPCIFQLKNLPELKINTNRIFKRQNNIQIQDIKTGKYLNINYKNYNPKKHIIFNQTIFKKDFNFTDLDLKFVLFSNYFKTMKNSVTGIHNEINSTLNFQLKGRKKWILVDPDYSDLLYPIKSSWRNYVSKFGKRIIRDNELKYIPHYNCTVKTNQVLFIPSWWWHHVISLEDNTESLSLRTTPPLSMFHKFFMPISPTSILLTLFISYIYKVKHEVNQQAYQLERITYIPTFK